MENEDKLVIDDNNGVSVNNNSINDDINTHSIVKDIIVDNSKEEKKKKNTKKGDQKKAFDPCVYEFSFFKSEDFLSAWMSFCEHRKAIRKPISEIAAKLIEKQLSSETEAVAIALLNNTVSSGWTGVKSDWMKEEEKDKINKQALAKELGEIEGVSSSSLPIEIIEERKKRQQRYELFGSSTPHKLKSPDPFPLELSIYHKVNGFPNDLRDNIADIIKLAKELPNNTDLANYSYRVPLHRYPHKTKFFQWAFDEWKKESNLSPRAAWSKMTIFCAYNEPVASQMLLDAAKEKSNMLQEIAPERLERMKKWLEPKSEEDRSIKEKFYQENELAWLEFRRREHLIEEAKKLDPAFDFSDMNRIQWPDRVCTFHEEIGDIDRRKVGYSFKQPESSQIPQSEFKW